MSKKAPEKPAKPQKGRAIAASIKSKSSELRDDELQSVSGGVTSLGGGSLGSSEDCLF